MAGKQDKNKEVEYRFKYSKLFSYSSGWKQIKMFVFNSTNGYLLEAELKTLKFNTNTTRHLIQRTY